MRPLSPTFRADNVSNVTGSKCDNKKGRVSLHLRVEEVSLEKIKLVAAQAGRSVSGQIRHLIENYCTPDIIT